MAYSEFNVNTAFKMLVNVNNIGAGVRARTILCVLSNVYVKYTSNNLQTHHIK